ncbi:hypothetical protein [Oxynema aestuarii]|jgi:hypothetical protein|uniref:Uncharacterized protein n=1 Tax=Oxynema aestuarii AP17 TaxID=2064643 RepID=A0A6H1TX15_9CYAN|nr:hypothetical protein [Oxynema aestuarii]QIZ70746.1 hypothetical protein HCG48_09255 [Oxynema aestuarii AP17]
MNSPTPPKRPDYALYIVRFICGALAGALVGWSVFGGGMDGMVITIASTILCGVLAAWWGDRFWHCLASWLRG